VLFSSTTPDTNNTYSWDFGDGNFGSGTEVSHEYSDTGSYSVTMYLTNSCGVTDSTTRTIIIDTTSSPYASFTTPLLFFSCPDQSVDFINLSSDTNNVVWNFGDGGTSTEVNPSYSYVNPGNYFINLQVTNACGITSSVTQLMGISTVDQLAAPLINCLENTDSITFSWDSIYLADMYEISLDSGLTWIELPGNQFSYSVLGVNGNNYSAIIRALGLGYCKYGMVSDTSTCIFVGVGYDEITRDTTVNIFPNPGTGVFIITSPSTIKEIQVLDLFGRTIIKTDESNSFDLRGVPAGSYLVKVDVGGYIIYRRIVLQK